MTFIDPNIEAPLKAAMRREDPRWFQPRGARLVNHPADRGGLTRGGITATTWGAYKGLGRPATREELLAITPEQALEFYFAEFVERPKFDYIPDQKLRALCVDWAFTSSPKAPWRAVQRSLAARGLYDAAVDGICGPATVRALMADREMPRTLRDVFGARVMFYVNLAVHDPLAVTFMTEHPEAQLANLRGWTARALEFIP